MTRRETKNRTLLTALLFGLTLAAAPQAFAQSDQEEPSNREPRHPLRNPPSAAAIPPASPIAAVYYDAQGIQRTLTLDDLDKGDEDLKAIKAQVVQTEVRLKENGCETDCLFAWAAGNVKRIPPLVAALSQKIEPLPADPAGYANLTDLAAKTAAVANNNNSIHKKIDFLNSLQSEQEAFLNRIKPKRES